jgi:hypothetical protein
MTFPISEQAYALELAIQIGIVDRMVKAKAITPREARYFSDRLKAAAQSLRTIERFPEEHRALARGERLVLQSPAQDEGRAE